MIGETILLIESDDIWNMRRRETLTSHLILLYQAGEMLFG